jgi:hypothetical protein
MVRWLIREEGAARIRPHIPVPPMVLLTARQMQHIFMIIEVLMPLGIVAAGLSVWWRRR